MALDGASALTPYDVFLSVWLGWFAAVASVCSAHPYSLKGIDANRSGFSPDVTAPFPLPAEASWRYEVPGLNRHQTSSIDSDLNVYAGSDNGVVQAFDVRGRLRWTIQAGSGMAQNPALMGDALYIGTQDGFAVAFDKDSGRELWRSRISERLPGDVYSPTPFEDVVIYPSGAADPWGTTDVVCLNRHDGSLRWRHSVAAKYGDAPGGMSKNEFGPKYTTVNLAPCFWNQSIIFNDVSGAMFRLSIFTGEEIWYVPGDDPEMYTLGGSACGSNSKAFAAFNTAPGSGALQALDLQTGQPQWRVAFPQELHAAPAIGRIAGRLAVILGVGEPPGTPPSPPPLSWLWRPKPSWEGHVLALDAETGQELWRFSPPAWREQACAGSTWEQLCLPDLWSAAVVDAAGTVWIQWSAGGVLYGLRDANGDGLVDGSDPSEVTSHDCGSGGTGPPSIAHGMIVATTCRALVAFTTSEAEAGHSWA